ncbi:MAG: DUF4344 domain-containing metallopeptidase [Mycobacterium sp.]
MRGRSSLGTVAIAVFVASGCGSASPDPKMTATYENASSGQAIAGRSMMKRTHLLENLADKVNGTLKLPQDIALVGAQCGEPNAFWSFAEKKITMCYEDANLSLRSFKEAGDTDPIPAAVNATRATMYHELAHAAIDFGGLPITGKEEDAADQLVVYLFLAPDENGNVEPGAEEAVRDYARMFEHYAESQGDLSEQDLADKHAPDQARMYNMLCWMYGSDPAKFDRLVTSGELPKNRSTGCEEEYKLLARSWSELFAPFEKPA